MPIKEGRSSHLIHEHGITRYKGMVKDYFEEPEKKILKDDLKDSSEYEDLMISIGRLKTYKEIEEKIFKLCEYAYSMGEAQGYYDATGTWKY